MAAKGGACGHESFLERQSMQSGNGAGFRFNRPRASMRSESRGDEFNGGRTPTMESE